MKEIELHQDGLQFLRSVLQGGDCFAKALVRTLPLNEGRIFTFLPDEVDLALISLDEGGLSKFDYEDDLKLPLIKLISHFLGSCSANMAVIEATSISPEKLSSWAGHLPEGFKYFTTERTTRKAKNPNTGTEVRMIGVYGFMATDQPDPAYIADFIEEAFPFRQVGALTSLPEGKPPKLGERVTSEWLDALASRTQHIFVGAYDGSGWVVWSKAQSGIQAINIHTAIHTAVVEVLTLPDSLY